PMHAYDIARLHGPSIVVRRAQTGEAVTTLDGIERKLTPQMTVIGDDAGVIGLAGVMGGSATEVTAETVDVCLECAYFTPAGIRRTRRTLGLSTEASYRFERGIDRWGGVDALRRCIEIIGATAGGQLIGAPADVGPGPVNPPRIFLRAARVTQLLGVEMPLQSLESYLVAIGATVVSKPDDGRIAVEVPSWRPDLVREVDLIEEVARLHGYEKFPSDLRSFRPGSVPDAPMEHAATELRRALAKLGLLEVSSLPTVPADGPDSVRLVNPLSSTDGYLRRRLLPGLVRLVERDNWAHQVADVRLFEIGTVFATAPDGQRPMEEQHVAAVLSGRREPPHWSGTGTDLLDMWDLKGQFEAAVDLAIPGGTVQVEGPEWIALNREGRTVGRAGLMAADAPPWAAPLFGYELTLDPSPRQHLRFAALPSTPSTERVLALLLAEGTKVRLVEEVLRRVGGELLESISIESDYRGPELPSGQRSVAFRLTFRSADRTLRDPEVDAIEGRMLATLTTEFGIHRRDAGSRSAGE
ncbi:MAG TPA: phenylalanine--tRNA ligase subunit beta, partial [Gemmatimonadales bacterium]|nr:phenylalanine--tRNA ligase subunit beta [Gemmatimonadales bacterium]